MKNKPKYFYRIFLPFVVTGVLAMILFNGFAYFFTKDSLEEKITLEKQENVVQTMNTIEQKLQAVDYTFNSYVYDPSFERIIQQPLAASHFDIYQTIDQRLNYISTFGPNQTTAELVSFDGNWSINQYGLKQLTDSQESQLYKDYMELPHASAWLKKESHPNEIQLVKKVPLHKSKKSGALIIHIPLESVTNLVYKEEESSPIFIYNQNGQLVYQSGAADTKAIKAEDIAALMEEDHQQIGIINTDAKEDSSKLVYSKSMYNSWIYVSKIDDTEFSAAMKPTVIGTVMMSILMLALTVIIAYLSSNYFSRPIQELQTLIPRTKSGQYKDEFELIGTSIRNVLDQNQSLENMVTSQLEQLKTLFTINLLHGRKTEDEIREELEKFGYPLQWTHLYVLVLQIDQLDSQKYTSKEKDVLLFGISQIVSEVIKENERLAVAAIDSKTQAAVFIGCEEEEKQRPIAIQAYAETIQRTVKELFNVSISVGISRPFYQLSESNQALEQGFSSLKYRLKAGKEAIVFYEKVFESPEVKTSYFPKLLENRLFDSIKAGDSETARRELDSLLSDLFAQNRGAYELEIHIMRFINDVIELMQLLGMDSLMVKDQKTLYKAAFEMETAEEIEAFIKEEIVYPMIKLMEERESSQYKSVSEKIIHVIQQEFDTKLTLDTIASRLHYNPNYLSEIFKKEFGQSFSDYLSNYRYTVAKTWLKDTNMSVKEIAERLQYNNSQNFIRFFRKMEGTTPGKYREQNRFGSLSIENE
ncbi:helix-turn-helix domain-containing protein [Domibacillus indicus]|uniref:helix-turn-helix domain-containing protein n=1 Tax=Domibacillus indicus TaxID=1437523 RepID=UPI000617EB4F|nr:helix-turn-helix domain-containing protein [Domibacillus indicus]